MSKPKTMRKTLTDVLEERVDKLISKWAERNKNTIWLGGPSRQKVKEELVSELREIYLLAKRKYKS